jgi:hypothetical protein
MRQVPRPWLIAALLVATIITSCASPNPRLYTIAAVPGAVLSGTPKVVEVHGVGIPQYLQRSPIVRSSDGYRLDLRDNDWWGEPLDAMLGRVLVADLSQRLPQVTIFMSSGAVTGNPEATVELEVQRMDVDRGGTLVFTALGSVSFKGQASADTRNFHISQPVASPTTDAQVAAASVALAQVADRIAAMLTSRPSHK